MIGVLITAGVGVPPKTQHHQTEATFVVRFLPRGGNDLVQALATNRLTCQQRPSPRPLRGQQHAIVWYKVGPKTSYNKWGEIPLLISTVG